MSRQSCALCRKPAESNVQLASGGEEISVDLCASCASLPNETVWLRYATLYIGKTIDVTCDVSPIDRRQRGQLALAGRVPVAHFGPAAVPEHRGRRPSGVVFAPENGQIPQEMKGQEPEAPFAVSKRTAKGTAEELTGRPVSCREINGLCEIEVIMPLNRVAFHGRTWFLALLSLKDHVDRLPKARRR